MKKVLLISLVLSIFMSTALFAETCGNKPDMQKLSAFEDCEKKVMPKLNANCDCDNSDSMSV